MAREFFVYIMTNKRNGTLYVGMTNDLRRRCEEHRSGCVEGFTRRFSVHYLAWYEIHPTFESAVHREKRLKKWDRQWKLEMIEETNPNWRDLAFALSGAQIEACPFIPDDRGRQHDN
jgi:putative endonuclease